MTLLNLSLRARAAAHGRVVEADVAAATVFAARRKRVAAGLNHRCARLVAARAADAAAVLGVFALAGALREVALTAADAVACAVAAAQAVAQHAAEVLQRATSDFIIAAAMDLAAGRGLFEFDGATWQHAPVGACRRTGGQRAGLHALARARERRNGRRPAFQQC
jgi:hypothetical protein